MVKITVRVEGMACGMCEAPAEGDIPEQELKNVVAKAGYDAVSVSSEPYEKKGLFGLYRR